MPAPRKAQRGMPLRERVSLLSATPLFESLSRDEIASLAPLFEERQCGKGDTLFEEGDAADTFFVVARGQLEVWGGARDRQVVNRLGPGAHLGEIALLTGGARTATVKVARPALLLVLDAKGFHAALESNAKLLAQIARTLSRELDARTRGEAPPRASIVVAVSGAEGEQGKTMVARCLAALLASQLGRPALLLGLHEGAEETGLPSLAELASGDAAARGIRRPRASAVAELNAALAPSPDPSRAEAYVGLIDRLAPEFAAIVIDAGPSTGAGAEVAAALADVAVELSGSAAATREPATGRVLRVVNLYNGHAPLPINHCEPFVVPLDPALKSLPPADQGRHVAADPHSPASPPLHRLARKVRGATVGVALAGGAAFGIAHAGVLQVLDEQGVPVDILTGTSMGSIVAALYAAGHSGDELAEAARRLGTVRNTLAALDVSFTRPGMMAGNRFKAVLRMLGLTRSFEELARPCQLVAADIETGERVCIGSGRLDDGCRMSASVPVVWAPVRHGGRTLVDGGIVTAVPVEVLRDMGADISIAVTVVPTVQKGVTTPLSRLSHAVNTFNPLAYIGHSLQMPSTVDIGMRSLHLLQYELANYQAVAADAWVRVDTSDFGFTDFYRATELVERGVEAAERALPEIKRMLAERGAAA